MIVLVGPSASGKSSIAKYIADHSDYKQIVTYTTRPMRDGEIDGVDYHFITDEEFEKKKNEDFFMEIAIYNNWSYGSAKFDYTSDKIVVLTPKGLRQLKSKCPNLAPFSTYLIFTDRRFRLIKMLERGDNIEEAYRRNISDVGMFDGVENEVDCVIYNDNYEKTVAELGEQILQWENGGKCTRQVR